MTPFYNQYLRPSKNEYSSKIAFIQTTKGIISKKLFYVKFVDSKKDGFYYDNNGYLFNILKIKQDSIKKSHNLIVDVSPIVNYFSYIKVIEDKQNPQLEGSIMIFKFGYTLYAKIVNRNGLYNKVFNIGIKLKTGFPDYGVSCYTDENINIVDNTMNLESELLFKTINNIAEERKEKLLKIKNLTDEIEEWLCE